MPTVMIAISGPMLGWRQQVELVQPLAVEEERERADRDDAGGQAVEAVDQVDRLAHAQHPQHRDQRDPVVAQEPHVDERQAEAEHRDAVVHQDRPRRPPCRPPWPAPRSRGRRRSGRRRTSPPRRTARRAARSCGRTAGRTRPSAARARTRRRSRRTARCRRRRGWAACARVRSFGSYTQPTRLANRLTSGVATNVMSAAAAPMTRYAPVEGTTAMVPLVREALRRRRGTARTARRPRL